MPALIAVFLLLPAWPAFAHGTESHGNGFGWTFDPWIVMPLALSALLYVNGYLRLRRRSRLGRGSIDRQALLYGAGWLVLAAALISPLHDMGEHLFTAHMVEHELVMAVSAPLVVLSRPSAILLWGLPDRSSSWIGRSVNGPVVSNLWNFIAAGAMATLVHGLAIWAWHVPALFDAAVERVPLHRLQHLSFFASALLFWWAMFRRSNEGVGAWHVFLTMLHTSLLGALIALSPVVLYLSQTRYAETFGMTALEDQQLAGFVMWIPAGIIYALVAMTLLARWIIQSGREVHREPLQR